MRTIQLIDSADGAVIETFITEEQTPLTVFAPMLETYGIHLAEGAGAQSTPIGAVVSRHIERAITARFAKAPADRFPPTIGNPAHRAGSGIDLRPPASTTAAPRPADLRSTALDQAPMPHRGEGPGLGQLPNHLVIKPGQADGFGTSVVLELGGDGQVVRAPAWRAQQLEDQPVERAPGQREALRDDE